MGHLWVKNGEGDARTGRCGTRLDGPGGVGLPARLKQDADGNVHDMHRVSVHPAICP